MTGAPQPKEREEFRATEDDVRRLREIAGEIEHLPVEFRRHFDQDGRDARYLRLLADRMEPNP